VAVLALHQGKIIFVKQYRYCFGQVILELPAGKIEKGESCENTAIREFFEETNIKIDKLTFLGKIYPSVGYTNEEIYLYLADNVLEFDENFKSDEINELVLLTVEEALQMIKEGKIVDAKTVVGVLYYYTFYYLKH